MNTETTQPLSQDEMRQYAKQRVAALEASQKIDVIEEAKDHYRPTPQEALEASQKPEEAAQGQEHVLVLNRAARRRLVALERRKLGLRRPKGCSYWMPRGRRPTGPTLKAESATICGACGLAGPDHIFDAKHGCPRCHGLHTPQSEHATDVREGAGGE